MFRNILLFLKPKVKIVLLNKDAITPKKATAGSGGFDIYAIKDVTIKAFESNEVLTGFSMQFSSNYVAMIFTRSSLGKKDIYPSNGGTAIFDSDYRDEVSIRIKNNSNVEYTIKKGDRFAQMVFLPLPKMNIVKVQKLNITTRNGGQGSTGK
ncbi:MAG: dUTP diphosphatase [Clostridia bacterium]